jgi:hypothetical protein
MALQSQQLELTNLLRCHCTGDEDAHPLAAARCEHGPIKAGSYPTFNAPYPITYRPTHWHAQVDVLGIYATLSQAAKARGDKGEARRWREHAGMIRGARAAINDSFSGTRSAARREALLAS